MRPLTEAALPIVERLRMHAHARTTDEVGRLVGLAGAARHGCVAVWDGGVHGACEVERVTRTRGEALGRGCLPFQTLAALGVEADDPITRVTTGEDDVTLDEHVPVVRYEHHYAHAASAYLTSPFERAAVLVCDSRDPGVSVWRGAGATLRSVPWSWQGAAFAHLFSEAAAVLGILGPGRERTLEALARSAAPRGPGCIERLWRYDGDRILVKNGWQACIRSHAEADHSRTRLAELAAAIQARLGTLLLELVSDIRRLVGEDAICLGGGLFQNTCFTTLIQQSGLFARVFTPINPGNAGLAVGSVMAAAAAETGQRSPPPSPFLGPSYSDDEIKDVLDNCKLTYEYRSLDQAIGEAVDLLRRGRLIGWFQGRMEWGPRALGHRSILANPMAPYALDNLNIYLKKRPWFQAFSVSVLHEELERQFAGPPESCAMEYEYGVHDPALLRAVAPAGTRALRVQAIAHAQTPFRALHEAFCAATGSSVLVHTSFNGFREPIVCTPRDAIRVFYGSGLDVLVIGRFVLRK